MIHPADIESLLGPMLDKIRSAELREKVVSTWVDGCNMGGFRELADLVRMPFTLLTNSRGVTFMEHTLAVTAGALALAEAQMAFYKTMPYAINLEWLVAGGLLHDVGKLVEIEPDGNGGYRKSHMGRCARHPISGTVLAAKHDLPWPVLNMIACHAKEGEGRPQCVETLLIHDADFATFDPLVLLNKGDLIVEGR